MEAQERRLKPGRLSGTAAAIPSKSAAHRIFLCAALADKPTVVRLGSGSKDIEATMSCVRALGGRTEQISDGVYRVHPIVQSAENPTLDCGESGSTLRFLVPVAAALGKGAVFTGGGRLPERPLSPLREQLEEHGCILTPQGDWPLRLSGKLTGGKFALPGNISSQFFTGLLLALPLLPEDSSIEITTELESEGYIHLTLDVLHQFGIRAEKQGNYYLIPGGQKYRSPGEAEVEGDWSNAAFWLTAAAMGNPVRCSGLKPDSSQGDKAILDVLRRMGAEITLTDGIYSVHSPGRLHGTVIDASEIPDLVPILSVAAATADGITQITHAARLRIKESDRLAVMADVLTKLGAKVQELPDGLVIEGVTQLHGGTVDSANDHRIAMSAAIAALSASGEVVLTDPNAVKKSYPRFFEDYQALRRGAPAGNSRRRVAADISRTK